MNKSILTDDMLLVHLTVGEAKAIFKVLQQPISSPGLPEIIDIDEVCRITGYKKSTIYDFIHKRVMPCHQAAHGGRRKFFKRSEINAWMQRTRINTREEAFQQHCDGVKDKQAEIEFLRRNLREAKSFLKLWQLIHSSLLIQTDKN